MRIGFYRILSDNNRVGKPIVLQPLITVGSGSVHFGVQVHIGYWPAPYYFNGYTHLEAREKSARILFGNNVRCNNNLVIICDATEVTIGDGVLIGANVEIYDADFHSLRPGSRLGKDYDRSPVEIGANVFIGSNAKILKGVTIGENTVIGNSAVVTKSFPANVIIGGNPAKIIAEVPA